MHPPFGIQQSGGTPSAARSADLPRLLGSHLSVSEWWRARELSMPLVMTIGTATAAATTGCHSGIFLLCLACCDL